MLKLAEGALLEWGRFPRHLCDRATRDIESIDRPFPGFVLGRSERYLTVS